MEKNIKIWKWTTIVMLLCNIGLLLLILLRPCPPPPGPGMHGGRPHKLDQFIIHELDLNKEQQVKFQALKKEHRAKIDALHKEGRKLRNAYFAELKKGTVNDSFVQMQSKAIGLNQQEIELATFNHFESLREILSDAQKEAFDQIIMEVLHRMAPPPPPPPPPPPADAPGPPPAPPAPPK